MMAFLKLIRALNLLIIALGISLFYYFILVPNHVNKLFNSLVPFTGTELVLFILAVVFIAAGGNIINDYFDFELDRHQKPDRPLPSGRISLNAAIYLHAAFVFAGIGIGFFLAYRANNFKLGYPFVICALLLYVYSAYLKKMPLIGNVVVSALTGFVFVLILAFEANFLYVVNFENGPMVFNIITQMALFYAAFAFITNLAREIVKDIEDMEGDAAFDINTFAVMFGATAAKALAALAIVALIGGIGYYAFMFYQAGAVKEMVYWVAAVIIPALVVLGMLFKAQSSKDYHRVSTGLKVIMLLGILSIPAFYLIRQ